MKWALVAAACIIAMIGSFFGVVWFLFTREGPDTSHLSEYHSAEVLDLQDTGSAYNVLYRYTYGGQTFYGRSSIQGRSPMEYVGICLDPDHPAQHAHTQTDCSQEERMSEMTGLKEIPAR